MKHTDESVKAGLQIEGNQPPKQPNDVPAQNVPPVPAEVDEDDAVHEETEETETPDMNKEQDMDELAHSIPPAENITTQEQDLDDLVHKTPPQQSGEENS